MPHYHATICAVFAAFGPVVSGQRRQGPCDIFSVGDTPCVAAHSVIRALYASYAGSLYQVNRTSDGSLLDVRPTAPGGFANAAAQDAFCAGTQCVISRIYDQSPLHNHLDVAPGGGNVEHGDLPVNATRLQVSVGGHALYAAFFEGGMGYRNDNTSGVATGNDPETLYMVTSGEHFNDGCCFDYGNAEVDNKDDGKGAMECVYFGNATTWGHGGGVGPWVMADLEKGLWAGNETVYPGNTPQTARFVTAMVKGGTDGFALKGGDATEAGGLATLWDGPRPPGYQPMRKQGALVLGIGGDNSNRAVGTFFEGAVVTGVTSDATDAALQANIAAVGYGR